MSKTIAVITGTRAEFGLLKKLIKEIDLSKEFNVKLLVTGTHLSKKHGETINEIYDAGFKVFKKVFLDLSSDSPNKISEATSKGLFDFSNIFNDMKPDLVIILGDRYEILSAVISAFFHKIPIAHIHGGEVTEGAIDDSIRHSITKFSHIHFVANEQYKKRVIQLGEHPSRVFNVGGMSIDSINSISLMNKKEIEDELNISFLKKSFLITYHPETLDEQKSIIQLKNLLKTLRTLNDSTLIFTMPNADPGSQKIFNLIFKFVSDNSNAYAFESLGQRRYFSLVRLVDGVIGNSSSGIAEVPYFKKPTINIGNRQKGRLRADSIIDCDHREESISKAIKKIFTKEFQRKLSKTSSPYGSAGATNKILDILKTTDLNSLVNKSFFDL